MTTTITKVAGDTPRFHIKDKITSGEEVRVEVRGVFTFAEIDSRIAESEVQKLYWEAVKMEAQALIVN